MGVTSPLQALHHGTPHPGLQTSMRDAHTGVWLGSSAARHAGDGAQQRGLETVGLVQAGLGSLRTAYCSEQVRTPPSFDGIVRPEEYDCEPFVQARLRYWEQLRRRAADGCGFHVDGQTSSTFAAPAAAALAALPVEEALAALAAGCSDLALSVELFGAAVAQAELLVEEVRLQRADIAAVRGSNAPAPSSGRCTQSGSCAPLAAAFGRDSAASARWAAAMEADMAHSSAGSAEAVSLAPPPLPDESRRAAANFAVWAAEAETLRAAAQADAVPRDTRSGLPLDAATCLRRGCQECAVPRHEGLKCASR